jgi:hypothetical protein
MPAYKTIRFDNNNRKYTGASRDGAFLHDPGGRVSPGEGSLFYQVGRL